MATKTWSDVNSRSKRAMVTNNESRCLSVKASPAASVVAMNPHFSVEQPGLGRRRLAHRPRWPIHFIPTCSSWLNQIERFFALSTDSYPPRLLCESPPSRRSVAAGFGRHPVRQRQQQPRDHERQMNDDHPANPRHIELSVLLSEGQKHS